MLLNLGSCAVRTGRLDEAIEYFSLGVTTFPTIARFYEGLGDTYRILGDHRLALETYLAQRTVTGAESRALALRIGIVQALLGSRAQALQTLEHVVSEGTGEPQELACALLYVGLGGNPEVLAPFAGPDGWPGTLIEAMRGQRSLTECVDAMPRVLRRHPHGRELLPMARAYLGMRAETLGNLELAASLYALCLEDTLGDVQSIELLWARDRLRALRQAEVP